jgi:hypothetical protein
MFGYVITNQMSESPSVIFHVGLRFPLLELSSQRVKEKCFPPRQLVVVFPCLILEPRFRVGRFSVTFKGTKSVWCKTDVLLNLEKTSSQSSYNVTACAD